MIATDALNQEWITLQNNFEQYEKAGLSIKLTAVVLFAAALLWGLSEGLTGVITLVLWVQEGILRTFQSRLGARILRIEQSIKQGAQTGVAAFQLHSEWLAGRKGMVGMVVEYAASALRPTVAFPYVVLLLIDLFFLAGGGSIEATTI